MRKNWAILVLVGTLVLGGCASQPPALSIAREVLSPTETMMDENEELPEAAPAFLAHFTDPLYNDPADEFAPFGSDEGWDMLYDWDERRDELQANTTLADVIEDSGFAGIVSELDTEEGPGIPEPGGPVDAATITVGAGFTLLRLTGHIDEAGRQLMLKALDILIRQYESPPQLLRQRADLQSWTG